MVASKTARWALASTLALAGGLVAEQAAADRGSGYGRRAPGYGGGYVVTESWRGGGRVAGRVRATPLGPQVQLPGGAWIYCKRSCAETLRAETVDFWDAQISPGAREQGILIYLWPR
jgi:hypothetical protein